MDDENARHGRIDAVRLTMTIDSKSAVWRRTIIVNCSNCIPTQTSSTTTLKLKCEAELQSFYPLQLSASSKTVTPLSISYAIARDYASRYLFNLPPFIYFAA